MGKNKKLVLLMMSIGFILAMILVFVLDMNRKGRTEPTRQERYDAQFEKLFPNRKR
jgi:hypothetical protein